MTTETTHIPMAHDRHGATIMRGDWVRDFFGNELKVCSTLSRTADGREMLLCESGTYIKADDTAVRQANPFVGFPKS